MYQVNKKLKLTSSIMMLVGLIALLYGFFTDQHSAWPSLLFNNYFFLGISLFAVVFVALQYISEAGWSIVLKRVPEAIMSFLPITAIIMLIIVIW